jgi:23S rRNA pseudouridine1911/1915/1917 synthase
MTHNNPSIHKEIVVPPESVGKRLDIFLTEYLPDFSRSKIQYFIEEAGVLLNSRPVKKNARCVAGDVIEINETSVKSMAHAPLDAQNIPLEILYEDEDLLAINKPAGMVVHPGNGNHAGTLVNALLYYADKLSQGFENDRPGIVHRLDKETSGVVLVAKTDTMHNALARLFAERHIEKYYIGLCFGAMPQNHGSIDLPLGRNHREPIKRSVQSDGKNALTEYWMLQHDHGVSIVRFRPHTGRTHQIRVHCSSRGFPIVGDALYGGGREQIERISVLERSFAHKVLKCFNRHALHARNVTFIHPVLNKKMTIIAPFPLDFLDAFRLLNFKNFTEN